LLGLIETSFRFGTSNAGCEARASLSKISGASLLPPTIEYAKHRVKAFLDELGRLAESEFPYLHSKLALEQLKKLFQRKLDRLNAFEETSDPAIVKQECAIALRSLFEYLPLAGFVLRSTNVRNAFEVFRPLLRLASEILEPGVPKQDRKTKLVISSEWDYSPFIYREIPDLPYFVLIGLPAPESANPLLIPLAGHELGHSLFAKLKLSRSLMPRVKQQILTVIESKWNEYSALFPFIKREELTTNMFAFETWNQAVSWCMRQAEETFCDFVGLRIFGTSFLHSFAYLLSPNAGPRSVIYPNMGKRIAHLLAAAVAYRIEIPLDYQSIFEDNPAASLTESDKYRVSLADQALESLIPELITNVDEAIKPVLTPDNSKEEIERICQRFQRVVPAENCRSLSDLLAASWVTFNNPSLWSEFPEIQKKRNGVLKELVLKNIEIFEIEQILRES
jgi:hypothetical protein